MIFELHPLGKEDVKELIMRAVYDQERGMGAYDAVIDDDAADFLADVADGDVSRLERFANILPSEREIVGVVAIGRASLVQL